MSLPSPRLQLRWASANAPHKWQCLYELVLPLGQYDIRRGNADNPEMRILISTTDATSRAAPDADATPFRDNAHSEWDAKALGGLPVYVIAPDGTAKLKQNVDKE